MTPIMLLPWELSWLQTLSVKTKYPHLQHRHGYHIVLTYIISLAGENGPSRVKTKTGNSKTVVMTTAQQVPSCFISVVKFEEHCFNFSRGILYSVLYNFSCKRPNLRNTKTLISLERKNISFTKENAIVLCFEKLWYNKYIAFQSVSNVW